MEHLPWPALLVGIATEPRLQGHGRFASPDSTQERAALPLSMKLIFVINAYDYPLLFFKKLRRKLPNYPNLISIHCIAVANYGTVSHDLVQRREFILKLINLLIIKKIALKVGS